jgi:cephalosporin hydroxylase
MNGSLSFIQDLTHRAGFCFTTNLRGPGDSLKGPTESTARLFEDGQEIGPAHSSHQEIEDLGAGRFSHWGDELYFSSSDGSSPAKNGRSYHVLIEHAAESRTALDKATFLAIQKGVLTYPYKDVLCCKNPFDMALYQMLIWRERPRTILELGTLNGGSALWFADILRTFGIDGHIHSLDIAEAPKLFDPMITFHRGDILDLAATWPAEWVAKLPRPILLIDDAGHQYEMSKAAIAYAASILTTGEYLVVEDGVITPMGEDGQYNGGPLRAVDEYLLSHREFSVDREYCDFFGKNVTWNIDGFLRKS